MVLSRGLEWLRVWLKVGLSPSKNAMRRAKKAFAQSRTVAKVKHQYHGVLDIEPWRVSQDGIVGCRTGQAALRFLL